MPECPDCPGRDHLAAVEGREATPLPCLGCGRRVPNDGLCADCLADYEADQ